ncbi:MAG: putative E3 ubiquitin-protein ligase herc4, partial [Paramarteilia canceri]
IKEFVFSNYPFLFSCHAKLKILKYDAIKQMRQAINNSIGVGANPIAIYHPYESPILKFVVKRDQVLSSALSSIISLPENELKKPLIVKFENEDAEDEGGVSKEFFNLFSEEIFDSKNGFFFNNAESNLFWINPMVIF